MGRGGGECGKLVHKVQTGFLREICVAVARTVKRLFIDPSPSQYPRVHAVGKKIFREINFYLYNRN